MLRSIKHFSAGALALMLALMSGLSSAAVHAERSPQPAPARLDAPITLENSFLVDFGYGATLRIPRSLYPGSDFSHPDQPVKAEVISMTFLFPDMTLTGGKSLMDIIFEKERKVYVPQKDRFPVRVLWMFYSPGNMGLLPNNERIVRDPRPPQIVLGRGNLLGYPGPAAEPIFIPSKYTGIREMRFPVNKVEYEKQVELFKKNGWNMVHSPTYVEKPGSPYELLMDCRSIECDAYVYSKKHHFQYRMSFPPEAVAHTDELIRAVETMISQWAVK